MMRRHLRVSRAAQVFQGANGCQLPSTAQLLVEGGDERIRLDPLRAVNQYGCAALPDPDILAFGSSTASVISARGLAAAESLRQRLERALVSESAEHVYAKGIERVRCELRSLCGFADLSGPDVIFATSGTDLHLIAAQLTSTGEPCPLAVMIDEAETGSQVPAALRANHFGICAGHVEQRDNDGAPSEATVPIEIASISVRAEGGMPLPATEVDAAVEALVAKSLKQGRRVLLILVDVAKTGLLAPSAACAIALKQRFPGQLDVMVDACQFRLAPATLRAYLAQGFIVAVTGSKFLAGPSFSGALLLPAGLAKRLRGRPVPASLWAYSTRGDWPAGWDVAALAEYANFGLLLRWEAALAEFRDFAALPDGVVMRVLDAFADAVRQRLADDPLMEALPVPLLERHGLTATPCWDSRQTIFPFLLRRPTEQYLSPAESMRIHELLQQGAGGVRCHLGQPVSCGCRAGHPVSALRMCASARLVVEAASGSRATAAVIDRAMLAFDQATALVRTLPFT